MAMLPPPQLRSLQDTQEDQPQLSGSPWQGCLTTPGAQDHLLGPSTMSQLCHNCMGWADNCNSLGTRGACLGTRGYAGQGSMVWAACPPRQTEADRAAAGAGREDPHCRHTVQAEWSPGPAGRRPWWMLQGTPRGAQSPL